MSARLLPSAAESSELTLAATRACRCLFGSELLRKWAQVEVAPATEVTANAGAEDDGALYARGNDSTYSRAASMSSASVVGERRRRGTTHRGSIEPA